MAVHALPRRAERVLELRGVVVEGNQVRVALNVVILALWEAVGEPAPVAVLVDELLPDRVRLGREVDHQQRRLVLGRDQLLVGANLLQGSEQLRRVLKAVQPHRQGLKLGVLGVRVLAEPADQGGRRQNLPHASGLERDAVRRLAGDEDELLARPLQQREHVLCEPLRRRARLRVDEWDRRQARHHVCEPRKEDDLLEVVVGPVVDIVAHVPKHGRAEQLALAAAFRHPRVAVRCPPRSSAVDRAVL
mmetsp:Transcript_8928/g.28710  ORF Transcript_8928/g.28710 Transcript_8928/m.28710 type:complete len:247 (-) Transcript_8928:168-908(-)